MEAVSPIQSFVFQVLQGLRSGNSLYALIPHILADDYSEFGREFKAWWLINQNKGQVHFQMSTDNRQLLVELLEQGMAGASIIANLENILQELQIEQDHALTAYLEKLPFRLLLPLLFCFFPAFLILLFGPLLTHIYREVLK